jgi:hypothetical protein
VRAATQAAGLGSRFSGHSGRIGMARRMVAAGVLNAAVQRQGRWKHGDMVACYTRGEAAGGTEVADLMSLGLVRSFLPVATPGEATMTDSVRPVCDCPEPRVSATPKGTPPAMASLISRSGPFWTQTTAGRDVLVNRRVLRRRPQTQAQ